MEGSKEKGKGGALTELQRPHLRGGGALQAKILYRLNPAVEKRGAGNGRYKRGSGRLRVAIGGNRRGVRADRDETRLCFAPSPLNGGAVP